jgi:hypothetical protein
MAGGGAGKDSPAPASGRASPKTPSKDPKRIQKQSAKNRGPTSVKEQITQQIQREFPRIAISQKRQKTGRISKTIPPDGNLEIL